MDLDTVIIYIVLFIFFVLLSVLKRRKKKTAPVEKLKPGLFGKLGDGIRQFVRELEKQALEAKKAQKASETMGFPREEAGESIWDMLDDRDKEGADPTAEPAASTEPSYDPAPAYAAYEKPAEPETVESGAISRARSTRLSEAMEQPLTPSAGAKPRARVRGTLPAHALQQAVVWSEVLGPPKALKRD